MNFITVIIVIFINIFSSRVTYASVYLDWESRHPAFDPRVYEDALDPDLCQEQLSYISTNALLRLQFLEAGLRIPRSVTSGNTLDLGNYFQCLGINEDIGDSVIQGKYCQINVPLEQSLPEIEWPDFNPTDLKMRQETIQRVRNFEALRDGIQSMDGQNDLRRTADLALPNVNFKLAVCVPKSCSTRQGIDGLLFNLTTLGFQYEDAFCRLPNDKLWAPADYVAIVIFSLLGLVTLLSTGYDLYQTTILKKDSKSISTVYRSFSVYTNTRRLTTFTTNPGALECLDGIRAISMAWVILGHTFTTLPDFINVIDGFEWQTSLRSIWITAAPIAVDTFFMLSGLLLVYTVAGKMTRMNLLKNLHLFYLNRILRMFPLLAAAILLQTSIFFRAADGPMWNTVGSMTEVCRTYWWINFVYLQNFIGPMCLGHTWYLAIDMQLHIVSPIVLFWVLSNRRSAWIALSATLMVSLIASTTYNFIMAFPGGIIAPGRLEDLGYYMRKYYLHTVPRISAFVVGMIVGYLLHQCRGVKVKISKNMAALMWILAIILTTLSLYASEPMKDINWDNQVVDSLVNTYMRPAWALGLGWVIFACVHGYGGPVNWLLSLQVFKLASRISYAMYLFHFPIQHIISGTYVAPIYFNVGNVIYMFFSQFAISYIVGFFATLLIDSPFSTLFKLMLGGGPKKPRKEVAERNEESPDIIREKL